MAVPAQAGQLVREVNSAYGRIDVLVNAAGVFTNQDVFSDDFDAWHSAWQAGETLDEPEQVDSAFLVRQIVTLKQSRRMRSGEVHYLDHPRLGVLIQVQSHKATGSP